MRHTLRSRLLVILIAFSFSIVLVTVLAFRYFAINKDSLSKVTQKIEETHLLLLKDIKVMHDFFENETINPAFFETGSSALLDSHKDLCNKMDATIIELYDLQQLNDFGLQDSISAFHTDMEHYNGLSNTLVSQVLKRGFKDYGTEGKMRKYAHTLESYEKELGLINILQLRRHEKDFIIRQEDRYILSHNALVDQLREKIGKAAIKEEKREQIKMLLDNYSKEFITLVGFDKRLGLKSGQGTKRQVDKMLDAMEHSLSAMVDMSKAREAVILSNIRTAYILAGIVFVIISISFAAIISRRVVRSITFLKEKINEFVESDFSERTVLPISDSTDEIDVLTSNFSIMEQHIVDQMQSLKQTNKDLEMLFYATSHDIQLPLKEVKRLTTEAIGKTSDAQAKQYLSKIDSSWQQLVDIIDELGIVTNIRNVEIETEKIEPESLIRAVFAEFKTLKWFDNIIFSLDIRLQQEFYSSKSLLKIIFRNLIENGIKYATKRSTFSFLKISISSESNGMVKITVSDNGIGIKKEYQDKIFDMFFRGTTYTSGTGLGLYIVQNSLEKLNGAITVSSDERTGTTFTLLIPNRYKQKSIREKILHNREIAELSNRVA